MATDGTSVSGQNVPQEVFPREDHASTDSDDAIASGLRDFHLTDGKANMADPLPAQGEVSSNPDMLTRLLAEMQQQRLAQQQESQRQYQESQRQHQELMAYLLQKSHPNHKADCKTPMAELVAIPFQKLTGLENKETYEKFLEAVDAVGLEHGFSDHDKVRFIRVNLEGEAKKWSLTPPHTELKDYREFVEALATHCEMGRKDLSVVKEFYALRQTGSVERYTERFEELTRLLRDPLNHPELLRIKYLTGLQDAISARVQFKEPADWQYASRLAKFEQDLVHPPSERRTQFYRTDKPTTGPDTHGKSVTQGKTTKTGSKNV